MIESPPPDPAPETSPHPWYGPCDTLAENGECAECRKSAAPENPLTGSDRQHLLACLGHHILREAELPTDRAMATAERVLRGMEALGWEFSRRARHKVAGG